jgi:RNA polymerase sigma-70 factor (ECF subfamily)
MDETGEGGGEAGLVRRAREGDEGAFQTLFDRNLPALVAKVRGRLSPALLRKVSVSDVLQETRITAFRKCPAFEDRGAGAFAAWLFEIAEFEVRRVVRRYHGAAKRAAGREVSRNGRAPTTAFAAKGPSPSEEAAASERRDDVLRALESLSDDHAEILRLTQFEGLSLGDAGARMGRSREAAKKLYGRALLCLTEALSRSRKGLS